MPRKEKVIKVIDGDTFQTDKRKNPVRLALRARRDADHLGMGRIEVPWPGSCASLRYSLRWSVQRASVRGVCSAA